MSLYMCIHMLFAVGWAAGCYLTPELLGAQKQRDGGIGGEREEVYFMHLKRSIYICTYKSMHVDRALQPVTAARLHPKVATSRKASGIQKLKYIAA